jgi:hypothetical protein
MSEILAEITSDIIIVSKTRHRSESGFDLYYAVHPIIAVITLPFAVIYHQSFGSEYLKKDTVVEVTLEKKPSKGMSAFGNIVFKERKYKLTENTEHDAIQIKQIIKEFTEFANNKIMEERDNKERLEKRNQRYITIVNKVKSL